MPSASSDGAIRRRLRRPGDRDSSPRTAEPGFHRQRRALAAAGLLLLAAALAAVFATRGPSAPPDHTAQLVPADALLYAHISTSDTRTQDAQLRALAGRLGTVKLGLARLAMAFTPSAGALDLERDVRPWLGDEVAIALVDGAGRPAPLLVAAVRDRERAEETLARLGSTRAGTHNGAALLRLPPRTLAAFAGEHLVVGPDAAVRGAVDRAAGTGAAALAESDAFRRAADQREPASSVDVFASSGGLRRLLAGRDGLAGFAGGLVTGPGSVGVSAQLSAEESGLRVNARVLRAPGAAPLGGFTPELAGRVPADAAAYLSLPGMGVAADLAARAGGAPIIEGLRETLPQAAGLELDEILAPLAGEAALSVTNGEAAPVFTLAARTRDEALTREAMAGLQGPLSQRLAGGSPFAQRERPGATVFSLEVTPQLEPSYAVAGGALVASTSGSGLGQLANAREPVTGAPALREVMPEQDAEVEALGFLDPRQLLELGERTGLRAVGSPALRDDLRRIRAAGAVVGGDATTSPDTTAELFLEIP